ncbi:MAG: RNA polymerase sigma factor RpoH [Rhodospirillaceae bacterium]|jgi:RNA polymerase sigma-32 factor|nr:RNA polymerase sigma factor RpoH [Rhodospirillaceae bacterium]
MTIKASVSLVLSPDIGLAKYLHEIRNFPVLLQEKEYMLAKRWREHGDINAAHQLVTSHLRLVAKMALKFRHYGLPLADLISEGNLGLMQAIKKFDPDKGFRLATYAMWWIKASLHEYVLKSWSIVRLGTIATHKKLFFNLRRVKAKLHIIDSAELNHEDVARIASELNVSKDQVQLINQRINNHDSSLNALVSNEYEIERQDLLIDESPNQEAILSECEQVKRSNELLAEGFKVLDKRERDIMTERHLRDMPLTLEELGNRYGISRERVRQIESRAFAKLQTAVKAVALSKLGSLEASVV